MKHARVRAVTAVTALAALLLTAAPAGAETDDDSEPVGSLDLLTDPFLQLPGETDVHVVWNTEFPGDANVVLVGDGVADLDATELAAAATGTPPTGVEVFSATTAQYSRLAEDAESHIPDDAKPPADVIAPRAVWRHEALVTGLEHGARQPYRVVSVADGEIAGSRTFTLAPAARPGDPIRILLTSDHQAMPNTPANLQMAAETLGRLDAVFFAGDLVNIPDRASEWFDDTRGGAFFPVLQGNASRASTNGEVYTGGEIIQHAPLFPAVGNHEVQGRIDGATSLAASYNSAVPRAVAEAAYERLAGEVNPSGDPGVREQWIEDNSFSTRTYEEIFTLPEAFPGGETYYAVTVGDVRLISLYATRIWRGTAAEPDPTARTATSRYQEAAGALDSPLAQGYGEHIFEDLTVGSEQLTWLQEELASEEYAAARQHVVMLHEGPQGLGDNVMPHFAHPERIEERDGAGNLLGVRYEYSAEANILLRDLQPLLEDGGVDLVHNGHSHLWNRFLSPNGVNYLETSNTGNSYGAYHELSGRARPVPPPPWDASNYLAQGNPGGLDPILPTGAGPTNDDGVPTPFVQSNDHAVFTVLDTGAAEVLSYVYDVRTPDVAPLELDRFSIGEPLPEKPADGPSTEEPTKKEDDDGDDDGRDHDDSHDDGRDGDWDDDDRHDRDDDGKDGRDRDDREDRNDDDRDHRREGAAVAAGGTPGSSGELPRTGAGVGLPVLAAAAGLLLLGGTGIALRNRARAAR